MARVVEVDGYHGTTMVAARGILASGFQKSAKVGDWLGEGIYFWQDAPARAWEWAEQVAKRVERAHPAWGPQEPAVLHAVVRLQNCLDLLDISASDRLVRAYQRLLALGASLPPQTVVVSKPQPHPLDCAVINFAVTLAAQQGEPIRAVRAAFIEGNPIIKDSALYDRAHVQIAVRDPGLIVEGPELVDRVGNPIP